MKRGKRYLAALMIVAMVFANVGPGVWAALSGTEKEVLFEIEATDLIGEIEEAAAGRLEMGDVEYESIDGEAGMFWETFVEGGGVYELNPEIRGGRDGVGLRLFVRLPDLAEELEESYRVTGEEEILLLYTNETPDTVRCRMKVNRMGEDGGTYIRVTKEVALSGYQSFLDGEELPEEESGTVQATDSDAWEGEGPGADKGGGPGVEKEPAGSEGDGSGGEEGAGSGTWQEGEAAGYGQETQEAGLEASQKAEESPELTQDIESDESGDTGNEEVRGAEEREEVGTVQEGPEGESVLESQRSFMARTVTVDTERPEAGGSMKVQTEDGTLKGPEDEVFIETPEKSVYKAEGPKDIGKGDQNPEVGRENPELPEEAPGQSPETLEEIREEEQDTEQAAARQPDEGEEQEPGEYSEQTPGSQPENPETNGREEEPSRTPEINDPVEGEGENAVPATGSNAEENEGDEGGDKSQGVLEAGKATDSNASPTATESNAGEYGEVSHQVGVDEMATARLCKMTLSQLIPSLEKQFQYEYEGEGIYVLVELPKDTKVPAGSKLWVEPVTEERDPERLARRRSQFAEAYGGDGEALDLYDMGFYVNEAEEGALLDGDAAGEAEPEWVRIPVPDEAKIYIRFINGPLEVENAVSVVRFGEESPRPRMLDILKIDEAYVNEIESLTFTMEDVSEFGIYKRGVIRHTGGAGTGLYRAAGMLLMLGAGCVTLCQGLYGKMKGSKEA